MVKRGGGWDDFHGLKTLGAAASAPSSPGHEAARLIYAAVHAKPRGLCRTSGILPGSFSDDR